MNRSGTGRLLVVGIGPGGPGQITLEARRALEAADDIVAYRLYADLVRPWLSPKRYHVSDIGRERERVEEAVRLAGRGRTVALIGSGDAGVYGLAGLAYEVLAEGGGAGPAPEVTVVPGVTAALAAAALLGAPLGHDFAVVSLSDLLTPWDAIERRLEAALNADFVLALYNPRSEARTRQWERACKVIASYRAPETPVGLVRSAYREGQRVAVTNVARLPRERVDMLTTVIVGNSETRVWRGRMLTPRGFPNFRRARAD